MKKPYLASFLFILLVLSASFELYTYYKIDSKEQFKEAADYIESNASPADVSVVTAVSATHSGHRMAVTLNYPYIDYVDITS